MRAPSTFWLSTATSVAITSPRRDRLGSRAYNLGNGHGFTNLEVVEAARRITGHPIPATIGPRRAGDPVVLIASADKIRAELGWQPRYPSLDQIIGSAWEWHRAHPHGYSSIRG